jgi:hypothetical protein
MKMQQEINPKFLQIRLADASLRRASCGGAIEATNINNDCKCWYDLIKYSMVEELKIVIYCNYLKHQNHSSLTSIEDHNVPGETLPSLTTDFDLT